MKPRPSLPKRLAAAILAAAFGVSGVTAEASAWKPTEDDALILELRSGQYKLGDSLRGYQKPDGICIDMADMIQALGVPVRLDKKSRRATGWIFGEDERFVLDRDSSSVQIVNKSVRLSDSDLMDTPEGWCADTRALSNWFGVTFRADMSNLAIFLETDRKLPFLQAIERRSRAARLRPSVAEFDLGKLPQADMPYKTWRAPSVDVMINAGLRGGPLGTTRDFQYELYASGELFGASVDARLASDNGGIPDSLRLRAYRIDPEGGLLGPLGATQLGAGDVESFAGALTGQSAVGRGIFVSNRPIAKPSRFSATTLRGELPGGWDAELYRNGQLMAFQADRGDGRYEFPDVELRFGDNIFEVVLYGPQGQIRRDRTEIPVGQASIPAGKTWYWAGLLEQGRDLIDFRRKMADPLTGWRWGIGVERGIDKRTTLGIGAQSQMLNGKRRNYAEVTASRAIGPMLLELSGAQQFGRDSGRAYQAHALGRIGRINFKAEALWVDGGYESEVVSDRERRAYGITFDTDLRLGGTRVPFQVGGRHTLERDGTMVNEWLTRASVMMRRLSLTAELSGRKSHGPSANPADDGLRLRLLANTMVGRLRLRGNTRFRLSGLRKGFEAFDLTGDLPLGDRSDLRASVNYEVEAKEAKFGLGFSRQFSRFALRSEGTYSTRNAFGLNLSLSMSFGPDPVKGGWRMSGQKLAQYGHAAVTVFRDENGDGVRSAGEEAVEGVEIATAGALEQRKTDRGGQTIVDGLRPFTPVLVRVDESSIEDPLLQPKDKGVVIVPRPGVGTRIMLPLAPTGEVDGTLLGEDGEPREGVRLELVDARGQAITQAMTEYDGYFLFDRVPYGAYRLRIMAASAQALGAKTDLGVAVRLDRAKPVAKAGTLRIEPAARPARIAAAP